MAPADKFTYFDIIRLLVNKTGNSEYDIRPDSDIDVDLDCTGDDFDELMQEYAKVFNVDMNTYRWYFHTVEEGHSNSIGRIFFKAPYERVVHIPVTPTVLLDSANAGKWILAYPEHDLPKRRYDIIINMICILALVILWIYKCTR